MPESVRKKPLNTFARCPLFPFGKVSYEIFLKEKLHGLHAILYLLAFEGSSSLILSQVGWNAGI